MFILIAARKLNAVNLNSRNWPINLISGYKRHFKETWCAFSKHTPRVHNLKCSSSSWFDLLSLISGVQLKYISCKHWKSFRFFYCYATVPNNSFRVVVHSSIRNNCEISFGFNSIELIQCPIEFARKRQTEEFQCWNLMLNQTTDNYNTKWSDLIRYF